MHQRIRAPRRVWWCVLLAVLAAGVTAGALWAQPPAATEVMIPVGATGGVPTTFAPMTKKIEVVPPIVTAQFSPDGKSLEISGLSPGFAQVRLLDAAGAVLQVINVQVLPPDLEIPFGDAKLFPAAPGTTIKEVRFTTPDVIKFAIATDGKAVEVTGIGLGTTKLTIIDNKGGFQVFNIAVVVSEKYLRFKIQQAVPTANVYPVQVNKGIFLLNGTVEKAEDIPAVLAVAESLALKTINALRVPGVMQVQLDVVIAQVSRTELRQMSFSWFGQGDSAFVGSFLNPSTVTSQAAVAVPATKGSLNASTNLQFGIVNDGGAFFGFLQALRTEGLAKFLACPKLVTMSGKPAQFQSGGELAVPEPSGLGTNAVTFKDFGTRLSFLPIVMGNGKILLEVEPSVTNRNDALGTIIAGTAVPGFDKQFLHATVEMEAGQTFAIGGLVQHQVNATIIKVPVLGDIPFLSAAFSNKSYNQSETELLILVTPYLVDPMACTQLPKYLPGQETRIPDDFELFLEGIIEAPRGQRPIYEGHRYKAAYLNSPSAGDFPCGTGQYGAGCGWGHGHGSCGKGGCGNTGQVVTPPAAPVMPGATSATKPMQVIPVAPPMAQPKNLPLSYGPQAGSTQAGVQLAPVPGGHYDQAAVMPAGVPATIAPHGGYGE